MPTLATLIKILSTSLWAYFKSFGCFIEKNRKQVFSGHSLGSTSFCQKAQKAKMVSVTLSVIFGLVSWSNTAFYLCSVSQIKVVTCQIC